VSAPEEPRGVLPPELPPDVLAEQRLPPVPPLNPFAAASLLMLLVWAPVSLVACVLLAAALHGVGVFDVQDVAVGIFISTLWMYSTMAVWCAVEAFRRGISFGCLFRRTPPGFSWLRASWPVVPVMLGAMGFTLILFACLALIAPDHAISYFNNVTALVSNTETQYPVVFYGSMLVGVLVLAPVLEELLFRGFLLNRWATRYGARKAIIFSALVFAIVHVISPATFFFGLLAGVAYVRTRTLRVPIFLHFLNNLLAVLWQAATSLLSGNESVTLEELLQGAIFFGIPMTVVGLAGFGWWLYRNWPPADAAMPYAAAK